MFKQRVGKRGEAIAVRWYRRQGYVVVARNYHTRFGELDLICWKGKTMVFVEVKTRTSRAYGLPVDSIDQYKLDKLYLATQIWLQRNNYQGELLFQLLGIQLTKNKAYISIRELYSI